VNKINLKFDSTITGLAGNPYGFSQYIEQVREIFDWNGLNEIIFPKNIEKIGISFIQGFFQEILGKIDKSEIDNYVKITTTSEDLTKKVVGNLKF